MTIMKNQTVYVRSMGKVLEVLAIVHGSDAANRYMTMHKDTAVIAEFGNLVFLANVYDKGVQLNDLVGTYNQTGLLERSDPNEKR